MKNDLDLIGKIGNDIKEKGGTLYFVGGYVRDSILNRINKDIDVEIHNLSYDDLKDILSNYGEVVDVGASFGVLMIKGVDIDFALPRTEKSIGLGHKDYLISVDPFIGLDKASKRRDFTINGIYKELDGNIIDLFGGIDDLNRGVIRHISDVTFVDDPLRVFRACQFSARFEFSIDKSTIKLCSGIDISNLPKERVFMELDKAMKKSSKPSIFFTALKEMNKLSPFFNELDKVSYITFNKAMNFIDTLKVKDTFTILCVLGLYVDNISNMVNSITNEKLFVKNIPHIVNAIKNLNCIEDIVSLRNIALSLSYDDINVIGNILTNKGKAQSLKNAKDFVSNKLVTSKDLLVLGIKPGVNFGAILKKAMQLQIIGLDKQSILKNLSYSYAN